MNGCGCRGERCRLYERSPIHGTDNGYRNYFCRCHMCTRAHAEHHAVMKAKRISRGVPSYIHGTPNGYTNYDCRCRACYLAHQARYRGYRRGKLTRGTMSVHNE